MRKVEKKEEHQKKSKTPARKSEHIWNLRFHGENYRKICLLNIRLFFSFILSLFLKFVSQMRGARPSNSLHEVTLLACSLVGANGPEPATSAPRTLHSRQLSYAPNQITKRTPHTKRTLLHKTLSQMPFVKKWSTQT